MKKTFTILIAAIAAILMMAQPVMAETITVGQNPTNSNSTSYLTSEQTFTITVGLAMNNYNPSNGQMRGNQNSISSNFYLRNTAAINGTISSITIDGITYNSDSSVDVDKIWLTTGSSVISVPTSGTGSHPTKNTNNNTPTTLTWSNLSGSCFCIHLTKGGTSGTVKMTSITITYTPSGGGGGGSSVTAPTLTDGCAFTETQTVEITPATGTTVYYTTDGSTPDNTKTLYSASFDVNTTTTVKAIAYDGDNNTSSVVEATYIKYGNISDITAAGDYAVTGTVVAKNNYSLVIGDGTGYVCYNNGYSSPSNNINDNISIVGKIVENGSSDPKLWRFETGTSTITTASSSSYDPASANPTVLEELTSTYTTGTHLSEYYSFTGTLIKTSASQYIVEIGKYSQIQLYGPTNSTSPSTTTLNGLENKKVNVTGYFSGKPSSWYSVMAETIEENTDPDTYEWVPVELSGLSSSDVFVIVGNVSTSHYAMSNDKGTSTRPSAVSVTISDDKISSYVPHNIKWTISGNATDGYTFYPTGSTTTWLYCTATNDGVRVGTNDNKTFKMVNNYIQHQGTSRYMGVYNNTDWRCYSVNDPSTHTNIGGQTFTFYKRQVKTTDPTVSASPSTIDDFSYTYGGGPSIKSFTVGGTNLGLNDITIDLTTHTAFQLSLTEDAETWYNSLTLSPTAGTVANTTVYVRMNTGLAEGDYSDNITVSATEDTSASVSLNGTVNPVPVTYTYILANTIEVGKHYLITSGKTGSVYVMGHQKSNNRNGVSVTVGDNGKISVTSDVINTENNVYEFVISGYGTNHWTIYDETDSGYLYAASSGNNYLRTQGTNDANGIWSVTIDSDTKVASIVAQGTNSRKVMQFNSNLFACYSDASYDDVYLFVKEENNCDIYSATKIENNMTVTGDMNIHAGVVTVENGATLSVEGSLDNLNPANLIIEDGGQLKCNNSVAATFQKNIAACPADDSDQNWYLISSPVGQVNTSVVTENHSYNLFKYNEADVTWNGNGSNTHPFGTLDPGIGYLYRKNDAIPLQFTGSIFKDNPSDPLEITLTRKSDAALQGFNLIGNPYSHNIQSDCITLSEGTISGVYTLSTAGEWIAATETDIKPCEGFLVQVSTDIKSTTATFNEPSKGTTYKHDYIRFNVTNSQNEDVAIALFDDSEGMDKLNHRNASAPMLYITQNNHDYAIATMSDDTKVFNLSFKAATMGQYTLSYKSNGEFKYLHIIDRLTGIDTDMLLEEKYTFVAHPNDNVNRFIVKLGYMPDYSDGDNDIFAYQNGSEIFVSGEGELQIFDVTGRNVMTTTIKGAETINGLNMGVYIFKLNEKVQKIVVR